MAVDGGLERQRGLPEVQATRVVEFMYAGGEHPHAPVGPDGALGLLIEMDKM